MKYTNFFDKMSYLFKMIGSSSIYPIFLVIIALLTLVLISKKIRNNKVIIMMIISYLVLFIITISNHPRSLSRVFDSIATNLFSNIYFPSTQVYLFTLLIIDIITIVSMLNKKKDKAYRIANGICFFTTKFLLVLILDVVGKRKIDIFSKKSLFSNTNLVVLLELSIGVFIIWLLSLIVIYVTNVITGRIVESSSKNKEVEEDYLSSVRLEDEYVYEKSQSEEPLYVDKPIQESVYAIENEASIVSDQEQYNDNVFTENNIDDNTLLIDKSEDEKKENIATDENSFSINDLVLSVADDELYNKADTALVNNDVDSNMLFDRFINNELPLIEDDKREIVDDKDAYTLNDYKTFSKMLKEIRDMNDSNIIRLDSRLDLRLKLRYSEEDYNLFKSMIKSYSN